MRLPLSPGAVAWLATAAGVELPWHRPTTPSLLTTRLSGPGASPPIATDEAARAELRGLGALDRDGRVRPTVLTALAAFARAETTVDVVLVRRLSAGPVSLHAWHRRWGDRVTWLTAAGGAVELGWCGLGHWHAQLTALPAGAQQGPRDRCGPGPRVGLTLPLPLVLGTGTAAAEGRADLLEELLRRPDAAGETEQLRLLHEGASARLRATVAGHGPAGDRRLGIVSWLRYDDGWRSLTPVHRDGQAFVRVDPVPPTRLGTEVARLLRGVAGR